MTQVQDHMIPQKRDHMIPVTSQAAAGQWTHQYGPVNTVNIIIHK